MEHLVVLPVMEQHDRDARRVRGHEYRRPGHPMWMVTIDIFQEKLDREHPARQVLTEKRAPLFPCGHDEEDAESDRNGKPAAVKELERVGCEEGNVEAQKKE